jgi:VanZ family protein
VRRIRSFRLAVLLVYSVGIIYLACVSGQSLPKIAIPHLDKIIHLLEFVLLASLAYWASVPYQKSDACKSLILISLYGLIMAFITEAVQIYIPYRTFSLADILFDLIGYFCIVSLLHYQRGRHEAQ